MFRSKKVRRSLLRHRYCFTLTNNQAFTGIVLEADSEFFVLVDARIIDKDGVGHPVDNQIVLDRAKVLYAQLVD